MMEDIAEQQDVAKEISDAISNPVAFGKRFLVIRIIITIQASLNVVFLWFTGNDIDEDELEKELEELEQEELDKELLGVGGPATELPEVPTEELKDKTKVKKRRKSDDNFVSWVCLLIRIDVLLLAVAAGPVEDDDEDMKQLMSWANWLVFVRQIWL